MSIQNILSKINSYLGEGGEEVLIVISIILAASLGSGITYIAVNSTGQHIDPVFTKFDAVEDKKQQKMVSIENVNNSGVVYASKNGKKYYYSNCSGLNRIKEENKVSFDSSDDAESQGYTLASGCK